MNLDLLLTVLGSGTGGAILMKIGDIFFIQKKDKKEFDEKVRDELWDRIKHLEGRMDEQGKTIYEQNKTIFDQAQTIGGLQAEVEECKKHRESHS